MKLLSKYWGILSLLIIASGILAAFAPAEAPESAEAAEYASGGLYYYNPVQDTITNTESDTLTLPTLTSLWSYSFSVDLTQLSGTADVAVKLEKSNTTAGDDWSTLESFTGSSGLLSEDGSEFLAKRMRIILTGSGTQSTTYDIDAIFKRKN